MGEVLLVNLEPNTAERLFALQPISELRAVGDPEKVKEELLRRPRAIDLLVLGVNRGDPIRVAEDARGVDPDLSIVILAEPSRLQHIERRIMYAPFLSGDVVCQSLGEYGSIGPVLNDAMTRTQQRRKHHDDVLATQTQLEAWKVWQPNPQQYLDRLLDHAPIGVAVLDQVGKIRGWNRRAATVLGAAEGDVIGARWTEFFHSSERESLERFISRSIAIGEAPSARVFDAHRADDDDVRKIEVTAASISSGTGEPGALVLFKDVTPEKQREAEQQRLEAQMQRTQKLESLGVLAGGIAHDFNNLLVSIVGNADLALMLASAGSPLQKALIKIKMAGGRASELTQQLLAYSGKTEVQIEAIDLNALVTELTNLLEISVSDYVSLDMVLSVDLPVVRGDLAQITQVLMNLITNAAEAIGEHSGKIMIATGTVVLSGEDCAQRRPSSDVSEGNYVFIDVVDTGSGMDASTCERIFEPFFTTKSTGRGLGLAAVAGIIRSHHGAIEVDSELDAGTAFRILLPAAPGPPLEEPKPNTDSLDAEVHLEGTILVVDDEEEVLSVLSDMLETFGLEVETAGDGVEAIDIFRRSPDSFSAVILDMAMPRMGGAETLQALRAIRPDIPVIICTGYNEDPSFQATGTSAFLQKPFKLATLMTKLEEVLSNPMN
ncbi:MAG: response regulator [Polyangiales bacterium]